MIWRRSPTYQRALGATVNQMPCNKILAHASGDSRSLADRPRRRPVEIPRAVKVDPTVLRHGFITQTPRTCCWWWASPSASTTPRLAARSRRGLYLAYRLAGLVGGTQATAYTHTGQSAAVQRSASYLRRRRPAARSGDRPVCPRRSMWDNVLIWKHKIFSAIDRTSPTNSVPGQS